MQGRVALVTGASRGVGRGVATALHDAGATVYATGRTILSADLPRGVIRVPCDQTDDADVTALFAKLASDPERLDVLVNDAWGGYERMVEDGRFTPPAPFGRAVAASAGDRDVMRWSGRVAVAAELGLTDGFRDADGRQPRPLREAGV